MLDALYGIAKTKHITSEKISTNRMQGRSIINEDGASTVSASTLLTDYMYKFTTRVKSDVPKANSDSTLPVVMVEQVEISDCQKASRNSEMQNNAPSHSHLLKSVDNLSDIDPKNEMKSQDTCPYVSLSSKSKKRSAGTDLSDHGEYIEYDDIARKRTKS